MSKTWDLGSDACSYRTLDSAKISDLGEPLDEIRQALVAAPILAETERLFEAFASENSEWLHRTNLSGHLTGSALVVSPSSDSVLLIHHKKLDRWLQPGGHADGDSNLARVAVKEVEEETGLSALRLVWPAVDLDVHRIPARENEPEHLHFDVRYLMLADQELSATGNHEVNEVTWVKSDDPRVADSDLRKSMSRAVAIASHLSQLETDTMASRL